MIWLQMWWLNDIESKIKIRMGWLILKNNILNFEWYMWEFKE